MLLFFSNEKSVSSVLILLLTETEILRTNEPYQTDIYFGFEFS